MEKGWTFGHINIIVKDIDKAIKHYQSLGATLFDGPGVWDVDENVAKTFKRSGKTPTPFKCAFAHLHLNGIEIEMHQPIEGESHWNDYFKKHGEGVDHINFWVDDVKKESAKMVEKGFPIVWWDENWLAVYFDTSKVGGLMIELSNEAGIKATRKGVSAAYKGKPGTE
jgi:methylmalonyl-CoA/ethylmalonyl-CoA epimerase